MSPAVHDADPNPASTAATALLEALIDCGLRHVVLSPGSRSQALALAAAAAERAGRIRLHVRIDERVGGFTALGIGLETGEPAAVVVTSGTAVAELHPAVLEAHHAGVPMLLLTADRPPELRGVGANQATTQPGIFGRAVRREWDVPAPVSADDAWRGVHDARSAWWLAEHARGPVHLNLAFRDPLSGSAGALPARVEQPRFTIPLSQETLVLDPAPGTVVIAGDKAGEDAEAFARAIGAPLLAEVTSGARFGPNAVPAYRALLDDPEFGGAVRRAVVFGHPTLSRQVPALLARADVETVLVRSGAGEWFDPTGGRARRVDGVRASSADPDRSWTGRWVQASRRLTADADAPYAGDPAASGPRERRTHEQTELAALRAPVTRRALVDAVWRATWPHDRLVLGASRLIREADQVVPGKRIRVFANRGLAGIDGTVSTATGIAVAAAPALTRVLLGDLALLHDAGALLTTPGEAWPRLQVIVGDDRGGSIFDSLEVAATADPGQFDRVLRTPRDVDLAALAAAYGWEHRLVATRGDLDRALTAPAAGAPTLLQVPLA